MLAGRLLGWSTAAWLCGCSAGGEQPGGGGSGAGSHGGSGAGATTDTSATGDFTTGSSSSSSGLGGGCAGTASVAQPLPLDLFIMLDQSGSMLQDAGNGDTRWNTVKAAITSFVQAPESDGIGVGIQYFGIGQPLVPGCYQTSCSSDSECEATGCGVCLQGSGVCQGPYNPDIDSCDGEDYAWADVPIQPLPGVAPLIAGSLGMHAPGTNTPTEPALSGAIQYATAWALDHPEHVVAVVFATDGDPSECNMNLDDIYALAAAGWSGTPSIQTFVIGVGPSLTALDGIAAAGGTGQAFSVDFDPMAEEQFLLAMNTIRKAALPCSYAIPPPPMGERLDFNQVNVAYTPGNGDPAQTFPHVADAASCPPGGDGWFYDDPTMPAEILLCQASCDKVGSDLTAELDIVLGCETIVP